VAASELLEDRLCPGPADPSSLGTVCERGSLFSVGCVWNARAFAQDSPSATSL
jgi:hypothetical protein